MRGLKSIIYTLTLALSHWERVFLEFPKLTHFLLGNQNIQPFIKISPDGRNDSAFFHLKAIMCYFNADWMKPGLIMFLNQHVSNT